MNGEEESLFCWREREKMEQNNSKKREKEEKRKFSLNQQLFDGV